MILISVWRVNILREREKKTKYNSVRALHPHFIYEKENVAMLQGVLRQNDNNNQNTTDIF